MDAPVEEHEALAALISKAISTSDELGLDLVAIRLCEALDLMMQTTGDEILN
jgi:hypothetical protein